MKKIGMLMVIGILSVSLMGCGDPCKENIVTKLGDKVATIGKQGVEKDRILAERAANRAAQCAKQKGSAMKKSLGF
jgi:hypothetical protein